MEVKHYLKPTSLEEAYQHLIKNPNNHLIGGGMWIKNTLKSVDTLIELNDLVLGSILETSKVITIGSMTTLRQIEEDPAIKSLGNGILSKSAQSIMGVSLRNAATIGGTVVGGYAFSDFIPALLVLEAMLVFYKQGRLSLADYLALETKPKDILMSVEIKKQDCIGYFHKVSNTVLDFAMINVAITKCGSTFRIAVGSRPGIASLAKTAMSYLKKTKEITPEIIDIATQMVIDELGFGSNFRASAEYRQELTAVYVKRGLQEVMNHAS